MTVQISRWQLQQRHKSYAQNLKLWKLYMAAYKGIDAIISGGYIKQHSRELDDDYTRRIEQLYSFAYSKSVVGIYVYHLMNKPPVGRSISKLENNELFQMFWKDADLEGNDFDRVMSRLALFSSIQGHMGILVDKPPAKAVTKQEQITKRLHPYMAIYHPPAILDWKTEKNKETHRPELVFLKLEEEDGNVLIITRETWAIFKDPNPQNMQAPGSTGENPYPMIATRGPNTKTTGAKPAPNSIPKDVRAGASTEAKEDAMLQALDEGVNELGEIPWIWLYNEETDKKGMGESDLTEIARIDISLVNNASQIEEIINFAAFPMIMKPKRDASPKDSGSPQGDDAGPTAVIEFDPEYPEAKPEWLTPEVESAINAILNHMAHKVAEIYRAANIGGLAGTEVSTQAKSGTALKSEFQILNSNLVAKATNLEKAENKIMEFFLKWEDLWDSMKDEVHMGRAKDFNVEDIATDLANAISAQALIVSDTFNTLMQKQVARQVLPSVSEEDQTTIDKEIEENVKLLAGVREKQDAIDQEDGATGDIIDANDDLNEDDFNEEV